MKKILILILHAFLCIGRAKAQLSGNIPGIADTVWTIQAKGLSPISVSGDKLGRFEISLKDLKPGIYDFGKVGPVYLEADYKLKINAKENGFEFMGTGKIENDVLQRIKRRLGQFLGSPGYDLWHQYLVTEPSIFIPMLNNYMAKANLAATASKSSFFKAFIKQESELDKRYCLYVYRRFYGLDSTKMSALKKILAVPIADRAKNYKQQLSDAYHSQFSKKLSPVEKDSLEKSIYYGLDMNNEMLYHNSKYYKDLLASKIDYITYSQPYEKARNSIKNVFKVNLMVLDSTINNNYIKAQFRYRYTQNAIREAKNMEDVTDIYETFLIQSTDEEQKAAIRQTYQNLSATRSSAIAPNFSYEKPGGDLVHLKDLKGSYIYIDIWATWCAPCIAEIPALKALETNLQGKNIKFVSISVDVLANRQKWLDFVKNNCLGGIQLIADKDFGSDFIKTFGVTTIPRFILIGPDGKIIDNDAKRPSDKKLAEQLNTFKL